MNTEEVAKEVAEDLGLYLEGQDFGQTFGYAYKDGYLMVQSYTEDGQVDKTYKVTIVLEEI